MFGIYLLSAPGTFYFEDSPELMASASMLGNSHPPGYALLMLLGRLSFLVPAGGPAFRFNLLSAACGAAAAASLGGFTASLARCFASKRAAVAAGLFAAGTWGLADVIWWEAAIGDKYALYYLFFMSLVWMSWEAWRCPREELPRRALLLGGLAGVAFTHHLYSIFALPALALPGFRLVRETPRPVRTAALALFLAALPLSLKAVYPPMRSAGGVELDWGEPRNAKRLEAYLTARLYHHAFASASVGEERKVWGQRFGLFGRLLASEIPLPLLLGVPAGAVALTLGAPWAAAALGGCILTDAAFSFNFFQEVARWYGPFYALLTALSGAGLAWALSSAVRLRRLPPLHAQRLGMGLAALLAVVPPAWQFARSAAHNGLSGFYSAHDMARNILRSLPRGSLYLGSGDFDLFPLWAARYLGGERPDVDSVGLGSFADENLAGMGGQAAILRKQGISERGNEALLALLVSGKRTLMVPMADIDPDIWEALSFLKVNRCHGLAARLLLSHWDPAGSYSETHRTLRTYTMRGLLYARRGAVFDLKRVRDEVARGALLHYPGCLAALGGQLFRWGLVEESAWAFGWGRVMMEALAGPVELPAVPDGYSSPLVRARIERAALAAGFRDLAELFEARGVVSLARVLRNNASVLSQ